MIASLLLPFRFDIVRLRRDLRTAQGIPWQRHYNEREFGGLWTGAALRSANGTAANIDATATELRRFRDTDLLDACPYFRELMASFRCPLRAVRLLSLAPGSFIREHSDFGLGYEDGEIRLHIPIETNPDVEFYVAGERLLLEEGRCYFLNVNLPHRVNNRGKSARIHLVIDAEVNDWVRELFGRGVTENWRVPRSAPAPRNMEEFRIFVLDRPEIQRELEDIGEPLDFAARVIELGNEHGFDFHDGDVEAALRCGPMRAPREGLPEGSGWTPVQVDCAERAVRWVYTGTRPFAEPFFEDSIRMALWKPFARMFRIETTLDELCRRAGDARAQDPAGFILHVSRCGSTLVSQMLAAAGFAVISEAPPIDEVMGTRNKEWLRAIVQALSTREPNGAVFIKLDAWHNRHHRFLRETFPGTPWIFVYRDPVEVLVSQMEKPGEIGTPGLRDPASFGLKPGDACDASREEWCARVLETIYEAGAEASRDPNCTSVDYRELPEGFFSSIAGRLGFVLSGEAEARVREAAAYDAKNPGMMFQPDSQRKQRQVPAKLRELCSHRLDAVYREMSGK